MTLLDLLIYAAASWYIAFAITSTFGPFHIFERLKEWRGGRWHGRTNNGTYADKNPPPSGWNHDGLLDCIICLSIWVSLALVLIGMNIVIQAFAVAGVALWLHAYSSWVHVGGK